MKKVNAEPTKYVTITLEEYTNLLLTCAEYNFWLQIQQKCEEVTEEPKIKRKIGFN